MLIDTHSHLYFEDFKEDLTEVIKDSIYAGVTTVFNVGVDVPLSKIALEQSQAVLEQNGLTAYSTIGIHPHEAIKYADNPDKLIAEEIKKLEDIYYSNPKKVIGVGECGLDFLFESNPDWLPNNLTIETTKQLQLQLLQAQINLAKKLDLPLIIHCRDDRSKNPENTECWDEIVKLTKDHKGIYHCYSGLTQTTSYILQATNFLISFAATLTYPKNEYLREAVKTIPLERICLETDSPFLPPQSRRGERNDPSTVKELNQFIADLKNERFEKVGQITSQNVSTLFKL